MIRRIATIGATSAAITAAVIAAIATIVTAGATSVAGGSSHDSSYGVRLQQAEKRSDSTTFVADGNEWRFADPGRATGSGQFAPANKNW